jgi:N-acetylmuramoyl-L-alanine amidase
MKQKPLIFIDPGHGDTPGTKGWDPGAVYNDRKPGMRVEAIAALECALALKFLLEELGFEVRLTRDGTKGAKPDLAKRLSIAAASGAVAFISLHFDMRFNPPRHRSGIYCAPGAASLALAREILPALIQGNKSWLLPSSSSRFNGLYIDAFPDAKPSVMLELDSVQYAPAPGPVGRAARLKLMKPIADAIAEYFKS